MTPDAGAQSLRAEVVQCEEPMGWPAATAVSVFCLSVALAFVALMRAVQ